MRGRDIGTTFSDLWYRVAQTRPRLSVHADVVRQHFGPTVSYIVEDPASGQFYRISESAHFFLGMLDGRTTVDEAWQACNVQLGDAAPTQREVIELLSRLQLFGLLTGDGALDPELLHRRLSKAKHQKLQRRTGKWMFPHVPLINPEPLLRRHAWLCRALFSPAMGVAWTLLVLVALVLVFLSMDRFGDSLNQLAALNPQTLATLGVIFMALRAVHEAGHAIACKAFGGRCTEIGLILIAYVLPLPYCDATSAWRFANITPRVIVSLGGILAETVIAAVAAIYWALGSDPLLVSIAYQTMLVSSVTTLLFNLNPLLRYDGYYILSDVAGAPNLAQRSREMLKHLAQRYLLGVRGSRGPSYSSTGEAVLLAVYGALSVPYRIVIAFAILLVIASQYLTLGVVLAVVAGVVWMVWPVLKTAGFLLSDPKLEGRRGKAWAVTLGGLALLIAPLALYPVPTPAYAAATVEPVRIAGVRALEEGFLSEFLVRPGERVERGQLIARLENPRLRAQRDALDARLRQARVQVRNTMTARSPERDQFERAERVLADQLATLDQRIADLELIAEVSGRLSPLSAETRADLESRVGAFIPRGTALALVVSDDDLVVRALVPDRDHALVFGGEGDSPPAQVRLASRPSETFDAAVVRVAAVASRTLPSDSLAAQAGGSVVTDPRVTDGLVALEPSFLIDLKLEGDASVAAAAGVRARVRLEGPEMPLGRQWWRRVRQFFESRTWL